MKLKIFEKKNPGGGMTAAAIRVTKTYIAFSPAMRERLKLSPDKHAITISQDEDTPFDWYIGIVSKDGVNPNSFTLSPNAKNLSIANKAGDKLPLGTYDLALAPVEVGGIKWYKMILIALKPVDEEEEVGVNGKEEQS